MPSRVAKSNLSHLKLIYAVVIFFGLSLVSLKFFNLNVPQRFPSPTFRRDAHKVNILSRLEKYISKELLESDWKELLELLENWKMQKKALRKKPVNQRVYRGRGSCKPRSNLFFLKIHKTGSSTIMNMLFRYGEFHNLTFALPTKKYQFIYPEYFSAQNVTGFSSEKQQTFNIMCHHMRFSLTEIEKVMPRDTYYFTILRNPETLMESSFVYNKYSKSFNLSTSIEDFLNNTDKLYRSNESDSCFAKNLMTFDLGFNHNGPESLKHFKLLNQMVNIMFDLVMITEYFDESLILLKDALCWTFDDVLSIPLNIRNDTHRHVLSAETKEKIKSWNRLDWDLYVYFNKSFWNRVDKFGRERMKKEVEELRKRRAQLAERCLYDQVEASQIKDESTVPYEPESVSILGYNLKQGLGKNDKLLCHRLVLPELQYTDMLWDKQVGNETKTHIVNKIGKRQESIKPNLNSTVFQRKAKRTPMKRPVVHTRGETPS